MSVSTRTFVSVTPPPIGTFRPDSWRDSALCANHPTVPASAWDDNREGETEWDRGRRIATAIAVCGDCPVRAECGLDVDLEWDEGVRGGVDLRKIRHRRKPRQVSYEETRR